MAERLDLDFKKALLKKQPCFARLTLDEIEVLANLLTEKTYAKDETIVVEGDAVDCVYIIVSGTCEVSLLSYINGVADVKPITTLGPDEAIGLSETGFYSISGVRTANIVALTDMVLFRLSVAAFHGFALAYPHVNKVMHDHAKDILGIKFDSE